MQKCFGRGTCNECNECECDMEPVSWLFSVSVYLFVCLFVCFGTDYLAQRHSWLFNLTLIVVGSCTVLGTHTHTMYLTQCMWKLLCWSL